MFPSIETRIRSQLLDRRKKLKRALSELDHREHLAHLLKEVDVALDKINNGTYGVCETCHETIEEERLLADPLCRNCLDHLSKGERKALEYDLDLAYQIQSAFLPKQSFAVEGWDIARHYEPAGPVSGDYCDLIPAPTEPGSVYFLLGDVSGKGVSASILMAHLHALFRSLVLLNLPVSQLVEKANRLFSEGTLSTHYATLVCGKAAASGQVEVCNAGHCPPLLLRNGDVRRIGPTGLPIGLFGHSEFEVEKIEVMSGDSFLLYTDGLTESRDPSDQEYGEDRLISFVTGKRGLPPQDLIASCLNDLSGFRCDRPKSDDLTIMALQRQ
jgi:sigma-B regulation protein RsbU (phosphoserine phosphatase)